MLIQVSGTFGSRQEEAQRLGRILRPKTGGEVAHFYTLVTRDTREQDFAHHRQLFLTEQGYSYQILDGGDLAGELHARYRRLAERTTPHAARSSSLLHGRAHSSQIAPPRLPGADRGRRSRRRTAARKKLAQDIVGRLTDRVLLIRPGRADAVVQELQKMGHTPQVNR